MNNPTVQEYQLMLAVNRAQLAGFNGLARALFQLLQQLRKSP